MAIILRKRLVYLVSLLLLLSVLYVSIKSSGISLHYTECSTENVFRIRSRDFVSTDPPEETSNRLFFLETSGRTYLKLRETCAVESAARQNPGTLVQVLLFTDSEYETSPSMEVLSEYPNVMVHLVNREDYFHGTPFQQWFQNGYWRKSPHSVAHLSDFLRILSLWKGGGTYLDMDFVIMKDISHLRNFSCTEGRGVASNGVIGMDKDHPVLQQLILSMPHGYNPTKWSANGPGKLLEALKKVCGVATLEEITPEICQGFEVLPPEYFYPVHYGKWKEFFVHRRFDQTDPLQRFQDSYAIHVWNKFSCNTTVQVGSTQVYALAAARYCPLTFAKAATTF